MGVLTVKYELMKSFATPFGKWEKGEEYEWYTWLELFHMDVSVKMSNFFEENPEWFKVHCYRGD